MSEESRKHNSHAAESWRELAGDVRQWADGHRLAITATVALVVLNFAYIYPILTDGLLTRAEYYARMWLQSWI